MQNLGLYLSAVLIWGSTWIVITFQLGEIDPVVSLAYRFGSAAILLLTFSWLSGRLRRNKISARNHIFVALQGLFLFFLNYWVFYLATGYLTSGLVAVLFSTIVLMNIVNQALFFRIRVQKQMAFASLFGLAGIILVFRPEIENLDLTDSSVIGLLLCLLATYLASIGNMFTIRNARADIPVIETTGFGMAYGAGAAFLYALISGTPIAFDTRFDYVWSLAYLAIFGSVLAFSAYLTLVGRIGADRASYAAVMFPIVALTLSTLFEGFTWTEEALIGVSLILFGNFLVLGPVGNELIVMARSHFSSR